MMAIHARQGFDRHAEISRRFPQRHAALHQPRRSSVAQCMRTDLAVVGREPGQVHGARERGLHGRNRLSVELDEVATQEVESVPSAYMCQQPGRDRS